MFYLYGIINMTLPKLNQTVRGALLFKTKRRGARRVILEVEVEELDVISLFWAKLTSMSLLRLLLKQIWLLCLLTWSKDLQSLLLLLCLRTSLHQQFLLYQQFLLHQQFPPAQRPTVHQPQTVPDQLSGETKHLRDLRKYDPQTFDGSLKNLTNAELCLSSVETIFNYMRCLEEHKVQCIVFLLRDRGFIWWRSTLHVGWEFALDHLGPVQRLLLY